MKLVILSDCYLKREAENPDLLPAEDKQAVFTNDWFEIERAESFKTSHWRVFKNDGVWMVYKPHARIEHD